MKIKFNHRKTLGWLIPAFFIAFILLQLWLLFSLQLFGDEAFYWLESQYFDISYTELPGWTAWMIRLGTEIFGNNYFAVRLLSYLGFLSVFIAVWKINSLLSLSKNSYKYNILLMFSIPIFMLIAVMALPDIWLVVFVMWVSYFLMKALVSQTVKDWVMVGVVTALSLNVHVRMWIWLFIAAIVFYYYFRSEKAIIKSAFCIAFPIAILGLLPIMVFNFQNDFALFTFQFGRRHPWQFQAGNINFLLSQFIVITPLVLYLFYKNIVSLKTQMQTKPIGKWIVVVALLHWFFYVIMSLFSDGLRTTVHWVLISYVPVLSISTVLANGKLKLISWTIVTGATASLILMISLSFKDSEDSNVQARLLDNSLGWHELAVAVERIGQQQQLKTIVADYFMTAAELAFELKNTDSIKVLPHVKSVKHGRQKQLQIMGMLLQNPKEFKKPALLVVEDSTLKLKNKGRYYAQLCNYFQSFKYLETVNIHNANKQFHIFSINQSDQKACEIPPIFYLQSSVQERQIIISGWAILHQVGVKSMFLHTGDKVYPITSMHLENVGIANSFPEINDPNAPNNGFEFSLPLSKIIDGKFKIQAIANDDKQYLSQIYFLD